MNEENGKEEPRPAEVVPIPLTNGEFLYDVHVWGWMWNEEEERMVQRLIFISCPTHGHANQLVYELNQTNNIGIDA